MRMADCHPECKHFAKGLCLRCYGRSRKAYQRAHYAANREKITAKRRMIPAEKKREWCRNYRARHREKLIPIIRARSKAAYWRQPEQRRAAAKAYREALKLEFFLEYGNQCACCGETDHAFLTLEHKNRDGAAHRRQAGQNNAQQLLDLKRRGWPKDDYEILCFNCNRATWELGVCPHRQRELAEQKEKQAI